MRVERRPVLPNRGNSRLFRLVWGIYSIFSPSGKARIFQNSFIALCYYRVKAFKYRRWDNVAPDE